MPRLVVVLVCALAAGGCEGVSADSIQRWKTTQKGPGKLQDALRDSSVAPKLRAEAAVALVDIGMFEEMDAILGKLPAATRLEIGRTLVPAFEEGMKDPAVPKARAARDGLFALRGSLPPEERKPVDDVLLSSIVADLRTGRLAAGRHSLEKMVQAIGPPAAPALTALLEDPLVPFQAVADLVTPILDLPGRDQAGLALVKRALATPEIPVALWRALGTVGGKPATAFLVQKVEKGFDRDAIAAAQALQQRRDPILLPMALRIAGDGKANKGVRDEMFGLVEKIGGPEAQRGLLHIIATDPTAMVRYRAYEAALEVGKGAAIVPALEAFPAGASFKKEDVVDFLAKDVGKIGPPAHPAVLAALSSPKPLARMTALLALEAPLSSNAHKTLGGPGDAPAVLKLSTDKGTVRGFPAGVTVGKEATRVAGVLQKKAGS
jgi:HEAT repeat protein